MLTTVQTFRPRCPRWQGVLRTLEIDVMTRKNKSGRTLRHCIGCVILSRCRSGRSSSHRWIDGSIHRSIDRRKWVWLDGCSFFTFHFSLFFFHLSLFLPFFTFFCFFCFFFVFSTPSLFFYLHSPLFNSHRSLFWFHFF